jgi:hypothetical protein
MNSVPPRWRLKTDQVQVLGRVAQGTERRCGRGIWIARWWYAAACFEHHSPRGAGMERTKTALIVLVLLLFCWTGVTSGRQAHALAKAASGDWVKYVVNQQNATVPELSAN